MTISQRITRLASPALALAALLACGGTVAETSSAPAVLADGTTFDAQVIEASCGECRFDMEGDDCDLAVRYEGKVAFVVGTDIDDHGDAHASDGFCEEVKQARVSGVVHGGRLAVTSFELVTEEG